MIEVSLSPALVIGTGLVGASVAMALTRAGVEVHLEDKRRSHALVAASRGAGTVEPVDADAVRLVVVATPPQALSGVIFEALQRFPNATITDVGSVKGVVLAALRATGADLARYCGSHPMAGSAKDGPITARADLFEDRTWVITPHDTSAAQSAGSEPCLPGIARVPVRPRSRKDSTASGSSMTSISRPRSAWSS